MKTNLLGSFWRTSCQSMLMLATVFFLLLLGGTVKGQVLLTDDFNYTGNLTANGWAAHSGSGTQPIDTTTGLTFPGYVGSGVGNAANIDNNGEDVNKTFEAQTTGVVYVSFMLNLGSTNSAGYFFSFASSPIGSVFPTRLWTNSAGTGIGIGTNTPSSYVTVSPNTTYLVVLKLDYLNKKSSLYVISGSTPSTEPSSVSQAVDETYSFTGGSGLTNVGSIALRQYNASQRQIVDGIRVFKNWNDVFCTAPTITTQPTSQTVSTPTTATFSVAASGTVTAYQWQVSTNGGTAWTDVTGATSASYTTPVTTLAMNGYKYRVVVSNTSSCTVTSSVANLVVNPGADPYLTPIVSSISPFSSVYGIASSEGQFAFSGGNLVGSTVTVTAPAGFELSKTSGSGYASSISFPIVGGAIASSSVYVRMAVGAVGAKSGNVLISDGTTSSNVAVSGTVTAKGLTIAGLTGNNKVYDKTVTATLSGAPSLVGVVATDDVVLAGTPTATFANASAADAKAISVSGYTLSGAAAANYTLTQPTGLTGNIAKKPITIVNAVADNKVYDGTTTATIMGALAGVESGDAVSLTLSGTFASADVATAIPVSSTSSLTGTSAVNYILTQPVGLFADITKAEQGLAVALTDITKKITDASFSLAGATTQGQSITYTVGNPAIATVNGSSITLVGVGTTTITAEAAGTANYHAFSKTVNLTVNLDAATVPVATAATDVDSRKFTANWQAVNGATGYELDVYKEEGSVTTVIDETFDWASGSGGNDGTWNGISTTVSVGSNLTGWSLVSTYAASQSVRAGTASAQGSITTPVFGAAGNAIVTFRAGAWNSSSEQTDLLLEISGGGVLSQSSVVMTKGAFTPYTINITGATATTKLTFKGKNNSNSRFFLDDVKVIVSNIVRTYVKQNQSVSNATSYNVTDLTPNTAYKYVVRAKSGTVTTANSNVIDVKTLLEGSIVTFHKNDGSNERTEQVSDISANLSANSFVRSGYYFLEWNTAPDNTGMAYADQANYNFSANLDLYAQWLPIPTATIATDVAKTSFTANWQAVNGATGYELDVYKEIVRAPAELVSDGGFENDLTGWTFETEMNQVDSDIKAYTGAKSLNLSVTATKNFNQQITVETGKEYVLSFWYFLDDTTTGNGFRVWTTTGATIQLPSTSTYYNTKAVWTKVEHTFTSTQNKVDLNFRLYNGANLYLDDISVKSIDGQNIKDYVLQNQSVSNVTSYNVTDLTPNTAYKYVVRAKSGAVTTANSNVISVSTLDDKVRWQNGAWNNGVGPDATSSVVVNGVLSVNGNGVNSFSAHDITIGTTGAVIVGANKSVTVHGAITSVDAVYDSANLSTARGLIILSDGSVTQNDDSAVNTGRAYAYRAVSMRKFDYTFWSSPFSNQRLLNTVNGSGENSTGGFSEGTPNTVTYFYDEPTDYFKATKDAYFVPGKGYAIRGKSSYGLDTKSSDVLLFNGPLNNGVITTTIQKSKNTETIGHGFNLIGNPYASNIDLDKFFALPENAAAMVSKAWFWSNVTPVLDQVGSDYEGNNYATWTLSGGVAPDFNGLISDVSLYEPSDFVKVGQGFLVESRAAAPVSETPVVSTIKFDNSIRTNDVGVFFKAEPKNRFRLTMRSPDGIVNNILIAYINGATKDYDMNYDAELLVEGANSLYMILGARKLQIQGVDNNFSVENTFPIGTKHNLAGTYTIALGQREGIFETNQKIFIHDKLNNTYTDLTAGNYDFSATKGTELDRFEIVFANKESLGSSTVNGDRLEVYKQDSNFVIRSSKDITMVEVYDISGKLIKKLKVTGKEIRLPNSELIQGVYVLKVYQNNEIRTKKIIK